MKNEDAAPSTRLGPRLHLPITALGGRRSLVPMGLRRSWYDQKGGKKDM